MVEIRVVLNIGSIGRIEIIGDQEELNIGLSRAMDIVISNLEEIENIANVFKENFSSKKLDIIQRAPRMV